MGSVVSRSARLGHEMGMERTSREIERIRAVDSKDGSTEDAETWNIGWWSYRVARDEYLGIDEALL